MNTVKSETIQVNISKTDSKDKLIKFLSAIADKLTDTNLINRVIYAIDMYKKDKKKVLKQDLLDLVAETKENLNGNIQMTIPVENQTKSKVFDEEEFENPEILVVDRNDYAEENSKSEKKTSKKKPILRKKVEEVTPATKATLPAAKFFPDEIEHEDLGKLVAVPNKYHSYKEVFEALDKGKTLYLACYWSARLIKEYDYAGTRLVPAPKKFPHDLDLLVACVPCEKIERVWCMSQYTEAMFMFDGDAFEPIEDTDPVTKEKFSLRVSYGMEFEIYEPVE